MLKKIFLNYKFMILLLACTLAVAMLATTSIALNMGGNWGYHCNNHEESGCSDHLGPCQQWGTGNSFCCAGNIVSRDPDFPDRDDCVQFQDPHP